MVFIRENHFFLGIFLWNLLLKIVLLRQLKHFSFSVKLQYQCFHKIQLFPTQILPKSTVVILYRYTMLCWTCKIYVNDEFSSWYSTITFPYNTLLHYPILFFIIQYTLIPKNILYYICQKSSSRETLHPIPILNPFLLSTSWTILFTTKSNNLFFFLNPSLIKSWVLSIQKPSLIQQ